MYNVETKEFICDECGEIITGKVVKGLEGDYCSEGCRKDAEPEHVCECCGEWHESVRYYEGEVEEYVCDACAEEISTCDECGKPYWSDYGYEGVEGGYCTEECRERAEEDYICSQCGEWSDTTRYYGGCVDDYVCDNCEDEMYCCDRCGEYYWYENGWDGEFGRYCSEECYEAEEGYGQHSEYIHSYSYKPDPIFWNDDGTSDDIPDGKTRYYGIEMEFNSDCGEPDTECDVCRGRHDKLYLKEDGSLEDGGFEVVSYPMTIDYHLKQMDWYNVIEAARYTHGSWDCGFHVHVSNSSFENKEKTQANLCRFFNFFWDGIFGVSNRSDYDCDHWCKKPYFETEEDGSTLDYEEEDEIIVGRTRARGRYCAVNLMNAKTTEIRMWNGIDNYDDFEFYMMMTDEIVKICDEMEWKDIKELKWEDIEEKVNRRINGELEAEID